MIDQIRTRSVGPPAARSSLITILGEFVLPRGGTVRQETLVQALVALGYTPQASRQAISRSVDAGWIQTEAKQVTLSRHMSEMLSTAADRIYSFGQPWEWDGRWLMVILRVPEKRRDVRHQLRTSLAWAGLGSVGGGVWLTPHLDREAELAAAFARAPAAEGMSFVAHYGQIGDPARIVETAWPLFEIAAAYEEFVREFTTMHATSPEGCFRAQTSLVHAWRKFPYFDPDLPRDLLPAGWPHDRAYDLFVAHHDRWADSAQDHFRALDAASGAVALP